MQHKIKLFDRPSPLQLLENISAVSGVEIWCKRDDMNGDIMLGGNKLRKFEYVFADALSKKADMMLFAGGIQSNMIRAGIALANRLGMESVAVYTNTEGTKPLQANRLLNEYAGAGAVYLPKMAIKDLSFALDKVAHELREKGRNVYAVPLGASTRLSLHGYIDAVEELGAQTDVGSFACQYVAAGSCGTYCGIRAALGKIGLEGRLKGISVLADSCVVAEMSNNLLQETAVRVRPADICDSYIGRGYGIPTATGMDAIRLLLKTEGILLDHVYTAKAFAALLGDIANGNIKKGERVLFWHTGGGTGLFALDYNDGKQMEE